MKKMSKNSSDLTLLLSHTSSKTKQAIAIWEISGVVDFFQSAYFYKRIPYSNLPEKYKNSRRYISSRINGTIEQTSSLLLIPYCTVEPKYKALFYCTVTVNSVATTRVGYVGPTSVACVCVL